MGDMRQMIEAAYTGEIEIEEATSAVAGAIELLDKGELRVAEPTDEAAEEWQVNEWVKEAILLYFRLAGLETMKSNPTSGISSACAPRIAASARTG